MREAIVWIVGLIRSLAPTRIENSVDGCGLILQLKRAGYRPSADQLERIHLKRERARMILRELEIDREISIELGRFSISDIE